jgi:glucose/arabinose dehydrogenase
MGMRPGRLMLLVVVALAAVAAVIAWQAASSSSPGGEAADAMSTPAPETPAPQSPGAGGAPAPSETASPAPRVVAAPPALRLQRIAGSYSQPVYVAQPPGDPSRLFIVEKTGRIRIVKDGSLLPDPFLDIRTLVSRGSEQGLLSMAFHPNYASNRRFFINYTNTAGDTRVVRYSASASDPDRADTSTRAILLRIDQPYSNHNGGQLQFGPDGRLYAGMGDGGSAGDPANRAQSPTSRLGKMLRITLGTSPLKVGVYAKGLRNPWRFSFDRATGDLWIGDVGQNAREEIDRLRAGRPAGANLGWSGYEGTYLYNSARAGAMDRSKLVWPVNQYSHSLGYAVTGGYVYRGDAIPALRGFYLFADYGSGRVWAMKGATGSRARVPGLDGQLSSISSFGEDAAGELYIVSLNGAVYRIVGG